MHILQSHTLNNLRESELRSYVREETASLVIANVMPDVPMSTCLRPAQRRKAQSLGLRVCLRKLHAHRLSEQFNPFESVSSDSRLVAQQGAKQLWEVGLPAVPHEMAALSAEQLSSGESSFSRVCIVLRFSTLRLYLSYSALGRASLVGNSGQR